MLAVDARRRVSLALTFALLCVWLGGLAICQRLETDEGCYVFAAQAVLRGELPYRDFLYHQMPLFPYLLAAWLGVFGVSWIAARLLVAVLAAALGMLVAWRVAGAWGSAWGALAAGLYALSGLVFVHLTRIHADVPMALALFGAYALVCRPAARRSRLLLGGLLAGLSIDFRLLGAAGPAALALWLWLRRGAGLGRARALAWLGAGMLLAIGCCVPWLLAAPRRFVFDNFTLYAVRDPHGMFGAWDQKALLALRLVGVQSAEGASSLSFAGLCLLSVAHAVLRWRCQELPDGAFFVAVASGTLALAPTPTYASYFAPVVPFLVVLAAPYLRTLLVEPARAARVLAGLALACYVGLAPVEAYRTLAPADARWAGERDLGDRRNWDLDAVRAVSRCIDAEARPNEAVLTWWPGYLFATRARAYAGMQNPFVLYFGLDAAQRNLHGLPSAPELAQVLARGQARLVVLGNGPDSREQKYRGILERSGYRLVCSVQAASLWRATRALP